MADQNAPAVTPKASAAWTYSWRLMDSAWPRTMRAMSSQSTAPTARNIKTKFLPKKHDQHDDEENEGQRIEHIDNAHHDFVGLAADEARRGAIGDADDHGDKAGEKPMASETRPAIKVRVSMSRPEISVPKQKYASGIRYSW